MFCEKCGARNVDGARFCAECGNPLKCVTSITEKKNSNKKLIIGIISAVIIVIALVAAILFGFGSKKTKEYESYIASGKKYVEELNYEQAKECYLQAINVAPKELEPYVRLAQIYVNESDIDKAEQILQIAEENQAEGNQEVQQQFLEVKDEIAEYKSKRSMGVEISQYFSNYKELVELLDMKITPSWQFGGQDSYVVDGFYLEWDNQTFSMKNESSEKVMIYGICLGNEISHVEKTLLENGWILYGESEESKTFLVSIEGEQYLLDLTKDENGIITYWYLNNWPEGENVAEYLDRLEDVEVPEISHEEKIDYIRDIYYTTQENVDNYRQDKLDGSYVRYLDNAGKIRKIIMYPKQTENPDAESVEEYVAEYYYAVDGSQGGAAENLVFAFVYNKYTGEEYRFYEYDDVLIRYIDEKKKTYDSQDGNVEVDENLTPYKLYQKGQMEIAWAYGG